ncbi:C4-dicarboxylate transporter DctA [soil metagenome]
MTLPTPRLIARRWNTLSTRILLGLVVGLLSGAALGGRPSATLDLLVLITEPVGKLWLDALTMTVVPLVFGLLVTGVGSATSSAAAGGVAARAMLWFVVLLVAACALSATLTTLALVWAPIPVGGEALRASGSEPPIMARAGAWFSGIIPANPIKAAAEMSMAPLVVFALFFGFAASRIELRLRASLMTFFEAVVATMLVIVRWVLLAGPLGVMALGFGVGAKMGLGAAGALAHYVAVVVAACLAITLAAYVLVALAGRISPVTFFKAALPVQVVALGTQSSLACLPAMIAATGALKTSPGSAEVVLPLSVSIFRAASAAANVSVAIYLAHLHGVALSPAVLIVGVLVAAAVSLAAVGLPAQVSFFATIGPVCLAIGVPLDALPVLLAVETIPDIFRTLGNVSTDLAVARIVGRPRGGAQAQADESEGASGA